MNTITLLVELQRLDLQGDENTALRASNEKSLADSSKLEAARAALENSDAQFGGLQANLRALELETGGLTDKLKQVNERLYGGRITNAKELAGLNDDERMLQRRKSELEDKSLALMEQIETTQNILAAKRAAYETITTQTNAQHDKERTTLQQLDASDAELERKRAAIRAQIDLPTLREYDNLRVTKKGRAVVQIKNNACGACGYGIPGGLLSRVKSGSELVSCSNCGRIVAP